MIYTTWINRLRGFWLRHYRVFAVTAVAALSGCASVGPQSIAEGRPAYNVAVQQTNDQELLLNLVRIFYRDTLYFTSVERIAATMELNQSFGAASLVEGTSNSFEVPQTSGAGIGRALKSSLSLVGSAARNEKPTVFYAPVEGEKFVRQMMTPMNPDLLLLLAKSGWSLDRVFALGVQEMNGLKNAPTAAGPTPSREPEFRDFKEAILLLRALQREQLIDLAKASGADGVEIRFATAAVDRPETAKLKSLLKLAPDRDRFRVVTGVEAPDAKTIALTTRPLLSALSYLSQGIVPPPADIKAGKVRQTQRANQDPFDWQVLLSGVFQVHTSDVAPEEASVVVRYRGHYFYIADNDLDSKSTFVLITQLMALHSAPAGSSPALSFSFGK